MNPDTITLSAEHTGGIRVFVIIPDPDGVTGLRVERHVVRTRPVGDPTLDGEVSADSIRIDPQIVAPFSTHDFMLPERPAQPGLSTGP